ncbi:MAG: glycosyltransferase family 2 protein [Candidatus Omnitrophota bacterium]|nr:MAG: glycosyltransferase family 2 protein [Candidatus Omnitrophota bacterium]
MNSNKPRLSMGMPVYNGENYIRQALDSLLSQTFSDFELIISDNGSTDRTEEICRAYAARDSRIHYYRNEENRGAAWNFNRVFELAKGEYFKWVAHDDLHAPEFFAKCVEVLDRDPSIVLAYAKTAKIDGEGKLLDSIPTTIYDLHADSFSACERFRYLICVRHSCEPIFGVIRSDALKKTPLIRSFIGVDRALLAQLALLGRFYEVQEFLFFWRRHSLSSTVMYTLHTVGGWWDPAIKGKPVFPNSRLFIEYIILINCASLKWNQKLVCYLHIIRWLKGNWRRLRHDVGVFGRHLMYPDRWSYIQKKEN